jgi:hypothetical protein
MKAKVANGFKNDLICNVIISINNKMTIKSNKLSN